jgi:hypothetical protein
MSIVLGAVSWVVLGVVWTHSQPGGVVYRTIWSSFEPGFAAGSYVGSFFFPNHAIHGTAGSYMVPLFGGFGELLLLVIVWYFCLRIKRAFEPEEVDSLQTSDDQSIHARRNRRRISTHFDGEHEPAYQPTKFYWSKFFYFINYERFKVRVWREFRDNTGHWPWLSICFHYAGLVGMSVCLAMFFSVSDRNGWGGGRFWAVFVSGCVVYGVLVTVGESLMRKLDWRLHGNSSAKSALAHTRIQE